MKGKELKRKDKGKLKLKGKVNAKCGKIKEKMVHKG
jgi:hypothetical protein